jgi:hypothetical protein
MRIQPESTPYPPKPRKKERAQPGDVLGIEEEGKVTELGDDAEDEEERLEDTEEKSSK